VSDLLDNMPPEIRMAGVAYVVSEYVDIPRVGLSPEAERVVKHRGHYYAHHWAIIRGLPVETDADHEAAIEDAKTYRSEHPEDTARFLVMRERGRQ
jgi:hypothetical protein